MSKVKHFLRKFHIGSGGGGGVSGGDALTSQSHHNHHLRVGGDSPETTPLQQHQVSNSADTAASTSSSSPVPALGSSENSSNANSITNAADFGLLEEEFQVQLALAISVSDRESREDPESAQIKAAKQISLGCPPSQSLVDFISLQYWSYNIVNYDERVMDGFYDVHGLNSNLMPQEKMPKLVDLQSISVLDNVNYQVTLVNCAGDPELKKLVEKVQLMRLEYSSLAADPAMTVLVQKIAGIVVDRMGGPVNDTEEILRKWTSRSYELRMSLNSVVLPLGCLDIGLSRHRALLFKVLADQINLRCMLVKGSYYTGSDDGAVNLIKFSNGSEYMIDLMGAPGTLIPSEVPSFHQDARGVISVEVAAYPEFGAGGGSALSNPGVHGVAKVSPEPSSASGKSKEHCGDALADTQMEFIDCDFGKISLPIGDEPLKAEPQKFASQIVQAEDTYKYVGNMARNPKLASDGFPILSLPDVAEKAQLIKGGTVVGSEPLAALKNAQRSIFSPGEKFSSSATGPMNVLVDSRADTMSNISTISEKFKETVIYDQSDSQTDHNEQVNTLLGGVTEWEIPWEDLLIGERIGIGSCGEVHRAEWNGTEVAVKKFVKQDISGDALTQFKCEIEIMLRLRHPNLVLFMGAVTRPPNLSILTEYLPRGSLFRLLHRSSVQIDEKRRLRMAIDVAKGMNYLHASHPVIVHRDLKTPNLLVDKNWVVKVCDFGMSRLKHHTFLSSNSTAGTAEWMAPEVLRNEPCNEKSDVYSFGVILWELATLEVPWHGMNSMQVVGAVGFQGKRLKIPERIDPMVADLINDCWNSNQLQRPSFGQILTRLKGLQHLVSAN